jgi:hypothetical protein
MTASNLILKLSNKQANSWGYKNEKESVKDGYNCRPTSCTVCEAMSMLKLNRNQVMDLVYSWRDQNKVVYTSCADLDTIYFAK